MPHDRLVEIGGELLIHAALLPDLGERYLRGEATDEEFDTEMDAALDAVIAFYVAVATGGANEN